MLRFILKTKTKDSCNGLESEDYFTLDIKLLALENILRSGGMSNSGYEKTELVGVEIVGD